MATYRFIKIKGERAGKIGYYVPRMHSFKSIRYGLKIFGFSYLKDRLSGWHYWWVEGEENLTIAIETLDELKKTNIFTYKYTE